MVEELLGNKEFLSILLAALESHGVLVLLFFLVYEVRIDLKRNYQLHIDILEVLRKLV